MLPTLRAAHAEFGSASTALDFITGRVVQRFMLPLRDLSVDAKGRLSHVSLQRLGELQGLPVTDDALEQVHRLLGVPSAYAARIDADLHSTSLRELLGKHLGVATVVEHERGAEETRAVVGVVPGARAAVPNELVLERLVSLDIDATVALRGGVLEARFGSAAAVDWLPGDAVRVRGALTNDAWGQRRVRCSLEVAVHLLRLICTNGLYAQREIAGSRAHSWSSCRELAGFVARQVDRVVTFPGDALKRAAARMAEEVCSEQDQDAARRLVERHASEEAVAAVVQSVTVFELMNAVTAGAHTAHSEAGARRLQVAGGTLLDRYIEDGRR